MSFRPCNWCGENPENIGVAPDAVVWTHNCVDGDITTDVERIELDDDKNEEDDF